MRRLTLLFVICHLSLCVTMAQHITRTFDDISISEALRQLNKQQSEYTIMFLYNELEDFRVTTTVKNKTLPEAIKQMIGFYPIRMTVDTNDPEAHKIFVECTHKTDRHLIGNVIDEH